MSQQVKNRGKHLFNGHSHAYKVGYQYCRKCNSITASSSLYKAPKESMLGRKLMMKFTVNYKLQWFKGIVNAYDGLTGKCSVYFHVTSKQYIYWVWKITKTSDSVSGSQHNNMLVIIRYDC